VRLLVQSAATGRFLAPDEYGSPVWVTALSAAGGGVVQDYESAAQLIADHCDFDHSPIVIDIDRLGTFEDYE
jgi:hypothetical protein